MSRRRAPNELALHSGGAQVTRPSDSGTFISEAHSVTISGGELNNVQGHHTNLVINVNPQSRAQSPYQSGITSNSPSISSHNNTRTRTNILSSSQPRVPEPENFASSSQLLVQQSNVIYQRHLELKGHGFPLWIPPANQNLPKQYRRTGVRIGDVGIITPNGGFSFLFNICLPHDDPVNLRLPEYFSPISEPTDIDKFLVSGHGSHLASASIEKAQANSQPSGFQFESSASEGAILTMPLGATSESLGNVASFRRYAASNMVHWYKFVNGVLGREAKNGDIRLVVGCVKTTSWGIATFANQARQSSCRLSFCPLEVPSSNSISSNSSRYVWEYSGIADVRAGPSPGENNGLRQVDDPGDVVYENQCLFLRTLNTTLPHNIWSEIHCDPDSSDLQLQGDLHPAKDTASTASSSVNRNPATNSRPSARSSHRMGKRRSLDPHSEMQNNMIAFDNEPLVLDSDPLPTPISHPSNVLNDILMTMVPTAHMVITDDDDWSSVVSKYEIFPDPHELLEQILISHCICEEHGIIFLDRREAIASGVSNAQEPGKLGVASVLPISKTLTVSQTFTPPLPPWPPPRSELAHHRPFKVLYDPAIDPPSNSASFSSSLSHNSQSYPGYRPPSYYRALMGHVRKHASNASVVQERIRGKDKGKEILYRCEGEVVGPAEPDDGMKEDEIIVKDPRKEEGFKKPHAIRSLKTEFIELPEYEYDEDSNGLSPSLSVLITGISPLTPNPTLRQNFQQYGNLASFEPQVDKEDGSALGILFLKFGTHEEAKRCVEKEHGRKGGLISLGKLADVEEWKAVLDGEGLKLKAVLKGLEDRNRSEKEDMGREWGPPFPSHGTVNAVASGSSSATRKDIPENSVGHAFVVEARSARSALRRERKPLEKRGLKGLSSKQVKEEAEEEEEEDIEGEERPKKKHKTELMKESRKVVDAEDIKSEEKDEDDSIKLAALNPDGARKRAISEYHEDNKPVRKKQNVMKVEGKGKKSLTRVKQDEVALLDTELYKAPAVTHFYTSPSPILLHKPRKRLVSTPSSPLPSPELVGLGLCDDDEDLYFAKLALLNEVHFPKKPQPPPLSPNVPTFHKHVSGSARTEGYYKITHAEKMAYVVQYQPHAASTISAPPRPRPRGRALKEINKVQRDMDLSKGENTANDLASTFNQLQTRKKHLRFARSPIHGWGLYAMEKISRGEMVIEYVGEVVHAQVADRRGKAYERQGIGSYIFRIDEDVALDATKKGNLGRLINHSCDPNCTAKIITISGKKKIVIYAKQEIELGDEITYDYHFPFEQSKIPCLCGSTKCRGFLN